MRAISRKQTLFVASMVFSTLSFVVMAHACRGEDNKDAKPDEWSTADKMMAEHLKRIDPNMRTAVYASNLLRKYLPDFKVFVRLDINYRGSETRIFVVNRQGAITPLQNENWSGKAGEKFFDCPDIAGFLARQRIEVKNAEDAVEVAKLFEELQDAASYVVKLKRDTKDFTLFDKAYIQGDFDGSYGPKLWKHSAKKVKNGWNVNIQYIGPLEHSIGIPPTYEIDLDEQQRFQDMRSR